MIENTQITEDKKKLVNLIKYFTISDKTKEIIIWDDLLSNENEIVIQKVNNLLKMMNNMKKKSLDDFYSFMDRDVEDDIWNII
jgi:hypothetical protein